MSQHKCVFVAQYPQRSGPPWERRRKDQGCPIALFRARRSLFAHSPSLALARRSCATPAGTTPLAHRSFLTPGQPGRSLASASAMLPLAFAQHHPLPLCHRSPASRQPPACRSMAAQRTVWSRSLAAHLMCGRLGVCARSPLFWGRPLGSRRSLAARSNSALFRWCALAAHSLAAQPIPKVACRSLPATACSLAARSPLARRPQCFTQPLALRPLVALLHTATARSPLVYRCPAARSPLARCLHSRSLKARAAYARRSLARCPRAIFARSPLAGYLLVARSSSIGRSCFAGAKAPTARSSLAC